MVEIDINNINSYFKADFNVEEERVEKQKDISHRRRFLTIFYMSKVIQLLKKIPDGQGIWNIDFKSEGRIKINKTWYYSMHIEFMTQPFDKLNTIYQEMYGDEISRDLINNWKDKNYSRHEMFRKIIICEQERNHANKQG